MNVNRAIIKQVKDLLPKVPPKYRSFCVSVILQYERNRRLSPNQHLALSRIVEATEAYIHRT